MASEDFYKLTLQAISAFSITTFPILAVLLYVARKYLAELVLRRDEYNYNELKKMAELSEVRASYENRIADLSREMVATRARFEDANHLVISGQRNQPETTSSKIVDVDRFLKPYGIDVASSQVINGRIFVLTPFAEEEQEVYLTIRAVCLEAGFSVARGDEQRAEGDILPQVVKGISESEIVIANISSRNPNVFFELGIAMAFGKPTLLISDTLSDVPFDLQSRRIILFKHADELRMKLTSALLQTVRRVNL